MRALQTFVFPRGWMSVILVIIWHVILLSGQNFTFCLTVFQDCIIFAGIVQFFNNCQTASLCLVALFILSVNQIVDLFWPINLRSHFSVINVKAGSHFLNVRICRLYWFMTVWTVFTYWTAGWTKRAKTSLWVIWNFKVHFSHFLWHSID